MRNIGQWDVAQAEGEPIGFTVCGVDFDAIPTCPFGYLVELMASVNGNRVPIEKSNSFIRRVLVDDDSRERWDFVAGNPDYPLPVETAQAIVDALIREYTGRPTMPPSGSPDGRPNTSAISTDDAPPPESTSETSTVGES